MLSGILLSFVGVGSMFLSAFFHSNSGWNLFLPQALILVGMYFLWLFASSEGISQAKDKSNGSAVMQFINLGCATLGTFFVGLFAPKSLFTIPIVFTLILLALLAVWFRLGKHKPAT
jgi:hypothetical protein